MFRQAVCAIVLVFVVGAAACRDAATVKQEAYQRGVTYLNKGAYKEAIVELRKALQKDGRFADARYALAQAYEGANEFGNAYKEFVTAAGLMPDRRDVQLKAGALLVLAREFEEAAKCAERVLQKNPSDVDALLLKGNALAGLRDLDSALAEVQTAIGLNPQNSAAFTNLAVLRLARGERADAEQAFKQALAAEPASVNATLALANYYWESGRTSEAEQMFLHAAAEHADDVRANRAAATYLMTTAQPRRAEPYMRRIADLSGDVQPRLALCDFYVATGRRDEARKILEEMAARPDAPAEAAARLAALRHAAGDKEAAHETLKALIAKHSGDARLLVLSASLLAADHRLDEALERANAAATAEPQSAAAHYAVGLVRLARGEREEAIRAFTNVIEIAPRAADAQLQLAHLYLAQGDARTSAQFAAQAAKTQPQSVAAHVALAKALIARADGAAAESEVRWLRGALPGNAEVETLDGSVKALRGDVKGAQAAFERALARQPRFFDAVAGLVAIELSTGLKEAARTRALAELAKDKDNLGLLILASQTLVQTGDLAGAEPLLKQAIQKDPAHLEAYATLGQIYAMQGRLDSARDEFEAMARQSPNSVPAHTMIGMILQAQNKTEETRRQYERVLQIDPRAPIAANNLAWLMADSGGNLDVALHLAQVATEGLPDRPEITDTLGWVYYRKGLGSLAAQAFMRSAERDPANPMYVYHLGLAQAQQGHRAEARAALQKALRLNPGFAAAADARRLLEQM